MKVLFLFESILPEYYHSKTISPGELRVIAANPKVNEVIALGRLGQSFYDVNTASRKITDLEKKIVLEHFSWPSNHFAYYFCWVGLLWYGIKICRTEKIDVIHAESPHISGIAAILLGKIFKTKVIVEYRVSYDKLLIARYGKYIGAWGNCFFWIVAGFVMKSADSVAANSKTYEIFLKNKLRLNKVLHYNPGVIVPDKFEKENHKGTVIGFIGRLYKDKGPEYFLELIALGQNWFRKNNVNFLMAGDGPERNRLRKYIDSNEIDDLIDLVGTQDRWEFYKHIDILVNTTLVEAALEMTIAEASSVGIPTVAFGGGGYPETVRDNYNGYIVEVANVESIYKHIKKLIQDNSTYVKTKNNAISYASKYLFENQIVNLTNIYRLL